MLCVMDFCPFFYHYNGPTFTVCCANVRIVTLFDRSLRTVCKKRKKKSSSMSLRFGQCCDAYSCDLCGHSCVLVLVAPLTAPKLSNRGKNHKTNLTAFVIFNKTIFTCLSWLLDKIIHGLPWQWIYSWLWSFSVWSTQVNLIGFFSVSSLMT